MKYHIGKILDSILNCLFSILGIFGPRTSFQDLDSKAGRKKASKKSIYNLSQKILDIDFGLVEIKKKWRKEYQTTIKRKLGLAN